MSEQSPPGPVAPINPARDLDVLWRHRGGLKTAYHRLLAYAYRCRDLRSTATPGGRQVAQLDPEEIVNNAIADVLTSPTCPSDGEELYRAVRRGIDNPLRTLEKSAAARAMVPIVDGTGRELPIADEGAEIPGARLVTDEEENFNKLVIEETRRRLKSPNCHEAQLLSLILEHTGNKQLLCAKLGIDDAKFDRLKFSLKTIATATASDLKKTAKK